MNTHTDTQPLLKIRVLWEITSIWQLTRWWSVQVESLIGSLETGRQDWVEAGHGVECSAEQLSIKRTVNG